QFFVEHDVLVPEHHIISSKGNAVTPFCAAPERYRDGSKVVRQFYTFCDLRENHFPVGRKPGKVLIPRRKSGVTERGRLGGVKANLPAILADGLTWLHDLNIFAHRETLLERRQLVRSDHFRQHWSFPEACNSIAGFRFIFIQVPHPEIINRRETFHLCAGWA